MFKIGDRVIWKNGPEAERGGTVGIVLDVTPDQKGSVDFPLYDVQFAFGIRTLHGSELQPLLPTSTISCPERKLLLSYIETRWLTIRNSFLSWFLLPVLPFKLISNS